MKEIGFLRYLLLAAAIVAAAVALIVSIVVALNWLPVKYGIALLVALVVIWLALLLKVVDAMDRAFSGEG